MRPRSGPGGGEAAASLEGGPPPATGFPPALQFFQPCGPAQLSPPASRSGPTPSAFLPAGAGRTLPPRCRRFSSRGIGCMPMCLVERALRAVAVKGRTLVLPSRPAVRGCALVGPRVPGGRRIGSRCPDAPRAGAVHHDSGISVAWSRAGQNYSPSFVNRASTSLKWKSSEQSCSNSPGAKCCATSGSALSCARKSASSRPACLTSQVFIALRWTRR